MRRLALAKAAAASQTKGTHDGRLVLAADTVVVLDGDVFGKPKDDEDARRMLACLSGRTHEVLTAVAVLKDGQSTCRLSVSQVRFRVLTVKEITAYVETGEPLDKAGAYAIQGRAAVFVERLEGSFSGVMGLPLFETAELLRQCGIDVLVHNNAGVAA